MVAPEQAIVRRLILSALVICFAMSAPRALANPIGDFFKSLGHSIAKLGKSSPPPEASKKSGKNKMEKDSASKTASGRATGAGFHRHALADADALRDSAGNPGSAGDQKRETCRMVWRCLTNRGLS